MAGNKGQFKKGVSGNPKGRPKKVDLAKKFLVERGEDIKSDALSALERLLEKAVAEGNAREVKDISKIILPFQAPRISSIESEDSKPKAVEIKFLAGESMDKAHPMASLIKK